MINFISQNNNKTLVLFVHGFMGGEETWINDSGKSFGEFLLEDVELSSRVDIATFSYYSKLTNFQSKLAKIKNLFSKSYQAKRKNIPIKEISNLLRSELKFKLAGYENIIVIAHSMGGLVTKCAILDEISEGRPSNIQLFISLAVPHSGAVLASFGGLINKNIQIDELAVFSDFINALNRKWIETSYRPMVKYFYASHDSYVNKNSAIPLDKDKIEPIAVDEDHNSISKPGNENTTVLIAVKSIITDFFNSDPGFGELPIQSLENDNEYNDELFVLKLIIADVHSVAVKDAKEMFLNAEFMRKRFDSETDKRRLDDLYKRVKKIYTDNYIKYQHGGINSSAKLLDEVKSNITEEDMKFLKCNLIPALHTMHKQGMLHQLANAEEYDIWWTKDTGNEFLKRALEDKGE